MPIIVETPSNMTVNAGDTTWLICKVSSMEDSQIVWFKHDNHKIHPAKLNSSDPNLRYIVSTIFFIVLIRTLFNLWKDSVLIRQLKVGIILLECWQA